MSASSPSTTRCSLFPFSFSPTVNSKRLPPADIITGARRSTWSVHQLRLRLLRVTISGDVANLRAATFRSPLRKLPPPEAVAIWAPFESLRTGALFLGMREDQSYAPPRTERLVLQSRSDIPRNDLRSAPPAAKLIWKIVQCATANYSRQGFERRGGDRGLILLLKSQRVSVSSSRDRCERCYRN